MKKKISVIFLAAVLFFAACKPQLEPPEDFTGNPGDIGLAVDLLHLTLDKTELATICGNILKLNVTKTPEFATNSEIKWTSSNEDAATVDDDGTIITAALVADPVSTVIRVESAADSSVYAECPLTVYPDYGSNRYWNLASDGWYASTRDAPAAQQTKFGSVLLTADTDIGKGMTLKGQTGSGTYENPTATPDGLPLSGGQIPAPADQPPNVTYPDYPWVYEIDPDNPYAEGLTPTNSTRSGMNWRTDTSVTGWNAGNLVSNGPGRIFSIAALQGPFYIEVRYTTNNAGTARWADIRIGDTEGLRIQGSPSAQYAEAGIVSYTYDNDDVVPFVYIESQASLRMYEIIIESREANTGYKPVGNVVITPATLTLLDGEQGNLSALISPSGATNPAYKWEIIDGAANGTIESGANTPQAAVKKTGKTGSFTVRLTVTTTNPDTGAVTTKTADRVVNPTPYKAVTGVSITGDAELPNGSTITLNSSLTPADATYPEYAWTIVGTGAAIDGSATGPTVRVKGSADSGSVTVKLTVTTTGYGGGVTAAVSADDKVFTLAPGSPTTVWRFNGTTALEAKPDWTPNASGYYEVTNATGPIDFGGGFKLVRGSSDTATAIRPTQNSTGLTPQITGCIQLSGSSPWNWGTLTGIGNGASFTLEIIYANTGGSNADRWPIVTVGGVARDVKGNSTASTSNATTGTVTLTGDGNTINLTASDGIRIFQVTLTKN